MKNDDFSSKNRLYPQQYFLARPSLWMTLWALLLLCSPSFAQSHSVVPLNRLTSCADIEAQTARLACYDAFIEAYRNGIGAAETTPAAQRSLLDSRWELARDSQSGVFHLHPHKPMYLLPVFYTRTPNRQPHSPNPRNTLTMPMLLENTEAKFQVSFKSRVVDDLFGNNGDLWVGYTQSSRWQVYNHTDSRPFRETNYEPEILLVFRNNYSLGNWKGRMTALSFNHQSNGRSNPHSRSWNRIIATLGLEHGQWALLIRPWVRLADPEDDDDNPDISDYVGRADMNLIWVGGRHQVSLMARHSFHGGERSHGAMQMDWAFPLHRHFRGHIQLFSGYGESLLDYNHRAHYAGVGLSMLEWF